MSVMTRGPDGRMQLPGTMNGRPGQMQPADPAQLQRQAVIDQLGTEPAAPAPGAQPRPTSGAMQPTASSALFSRGGQVKELPGGSLSTTLARTAAGTGTQIAGKLAGNTVAGAAVGSGINVGAGMLADKVRTKEEAPTFGGEFGNITDDYGRRFQGTGGGTAAGAIRGAGYGANPGLVAATGGLSVVGGAAIGAAIAAAKRHAASAFSDFRVEDAADAIQKVYQQELGRPASDDEIQGQLVGQGWDPKGGDRWVGEKNLMSVLGQIRNSPEAQQFAAGGGTRAAVVDQLADTSVPAGAVRLPAEGAPAAGGAAAGGGGGRGVLEGFDAGKLADTGHNSPKYVFARIAQQFDQRDPAQREAMVQALKADPSGYFANASLSGDILDAGSNDPKFEGITRFDVVRDVENGGAWQWAPAGEGGGGGAAPSSSPASGMGGLESRLGLPPGSIQTTGDQDGMAAIRAELERIIRGEAPRDALLAQMGGA